MREPNLERPHPAGMGGTQKLYRFPNGYGASVVRFPHSYGYHNGKWELAVLKYSGEGENDYDLCYDTPITDDVLGHLPESTVDKVLSEIESLPEAV